MASVPKRHHQVPRFYLERFASGGKVVVRRRDGRTFEASPVNVAVESGFYDIPDGSGGVSKEIEVGLSDIEGMADSVLRGIDSTGRPPGETSEDSAVLALFVGLQMARTTQHREQVMFPRRVIDWAAGRPVTRDVVAEYLETQHLGFKPDPDEVDGAYVMVTTAEKAPDAMKDEFAVEMMLRSGIELSRRLLGFHWSVEHDRRAEFLISDTPVVLWRKRRLEDEFRGFGIENAQEIRFPLDPAKQIVFSRRPRDQRYDVAPHRVRHCHEDMIDACHLFIVGSPTHRAYIDRLHVDRWRPNSRFNVGPFVGEDGKPMPGGGEVTHMWVPRGASVGRRKRESRR